MSIFGLVFFASCYFSVDFLVLVGAPLVQNGSKNLQQLIHLACFVSPFGPTRPKSTYTHTHTHTHTHTYTRQRPQTSNPQSNKRWSYNIGSRSPLPQTQDERHSSMRGHLGRKRSDHLGDPPGTPSVPPNVQRHEKASCDQANVALSARNSLRSLGTRSPVHCTAGPHMAEHRPKLQRPAERPWPYAYQPRVGALAGTGGVNEIRLERSYGTLEPINQADRNDFPENIYGVKYTIYIYYKYRLGLAYIYIYIYMYVNIHIYIYVFILLHYFRLYMLRATRLN